MAALCTVVYIATKNHEARFSTVHNDNTEVSALLKVRTTGLPMMWYFANGGQLFDLNLINPYKALENLDAFY